MAIETITQGVVIADTYAELTSTSCNKGGVAYAKDTNKWYTWDGTSYIAIATASSAWPVGSVFISVISTNPNTLLGFGTWAAIGAGRVLVGLDSTDTDFDLVEETGGAKTVASAGTNSVPTFSGSALGTHSHGAGTLAPSAHSGTAVDAHSGTVVADHASHTHTYTDVVNHVHVENMQSAQTGPNVGWAAGDSSTNTPVATGYSTANPTGGVATGTTAGPSAVLTHAVTQPANHVVTQPSNHTMSGSTSADSAGTPAGTVTAPTFTGSPTSVVQPYFVVYMWKRTA